MEFAFTLRYKLSNDDSNVDDLLERLGEAGCTDALVGIGQAGRMSLEFVREAKNAIEALSSAFADVRKAFPDAELIEAAPDFVGLTEVAVAAKVSRQNIRKFMINHASSFPVPVHEGSSSIWHLSDVLAWLRDQRGYELDSAMLEVAKAAMQMNLAKEARQIAPQVPRKVRELFV